ncbi:putative Glycosyltransferase family 28 protein [Leptomonas pyrrhocoris]|uniref:UDP-N-acetylglucosamine transferase subunit ALG14 n=1 Tax=Leptomonas pyrrhocoris TaxID=157538 RepID=A0A0N0DXJ5_LEPPY|nr:putative Glycosyltransferase family 28 protein [Leptomonas pyrrhocoris]KPA83031.1 putative Glycosyltransferase family 28 protein [Leptomonas pyrrhocoris]|eukprot:XP_015661470.1 putative Glycosyltransferase family 28 protein [Leptomonas pyrrhocoris]
MWFLALVVLLLLLCAFLLSLWLSVWHHQPVALCAPHRRPMKIGVVLGSGGHTSEMLRAISELPSAFWHDNRPFYVVSATDAHSGDLAQQQEQKLFKRRAIVYKIPRAREVGQSYITSVASTLEAAAASLRVIFAERPDVLLTNGPGVCIPVIAAALCVAACLPWWYKRPAIVYMESFTCVAHLSLTGRLLAPFVADVFTVHWRSLEKAVQQCRRRGTLVYIGCEEADETQGVSSGTTTTTAAAFASDRFPPPLPSEQEPYALVTVGSTRFTALVETMVQPTLCAALKKHFRLSTLYVQYGTAALSMPAGATAMRATLQDGEAPLSSPVQQWICGGLRVEAFPYRPHLDALIRTATLVVTHAGAGTILEGLQACRPLVVVPNRQLMSDHQLELADGLAAGRFLFSLPVTQLAEQLPTLDVSVLRRHRGMDVEQLRTSLRLVLAGHADASGNSKAD